jgi:hypothetical protein
MERVFDGYDPRHDERDRRESEQRNVGSPGTSDRSRSEGTQPSDVFTRDLDLPLGPKRDTAREAGGAGRGVPGRGEARARSEPRPLSPPRLDALRDGRGGRAPPSHCRRHRGCGRHPRSRRPRVGTGTAQGDVRRIRFLSRQPRPAPGPQPRTDDRSGRSHDSLARVARRAFSGSRRPHGSVAGSDSFASLAERTLRGHEPYRPKTKSDRLALWRHDAHAR